MWLCHLVFASRMWKTNTGRVWEARIDPVFRHFIPRSSGIWTVGASRITFSFFNLFALSLWIQALPSMQPFWSLHLPHSSLVPATLALLWWSWSLPKSLQLAHEWTLRVVAVPSFSGLGKSLRIFHPLRRGTFLSSVSVPVLPHFTTVSLPQS